MKNLPSSPQKCNSLVVLSHGKPVTTSLQVADVFQKRHKDVIRAVERLDCSRDFTRRNFALSGYTDPTGRTLPMYHVTRDGFTFLAMGFRGKKAAQFKERYIGEFNRMEAALHQRHDPAWLQSRAQGKLVRRAETDAIKELLDHARNQGSRNPEKYYVNATRLAYRALGFHGEHQPIRDMLNPQQQATLTLVEATIAETIRAGIAAGTSYKDIYQATKSRVFELATVLTPVSKLAA